MGKSFLSALSRTFATGVLFLVMVPGSAWGQSVTVEGRVVERTQTSWIGGATVQLSGSRLFFTDLDGRFRFTGVTPGRHTLTVLALGYQTRSLELDIQSDTTLTIELDPDPIVLDSLLVRSRSGNIKIKGDVRDAETGRKLPHAYVSVQPGVQTAEAIDGFFILRKVPIGRALTVLVEAVEYLPARIAVITDTDTTLTIEMEPDPVGTRLLAEKVQMLEARSNSLPYRRRVVDKEEIEWFSGWTIYELVTRGLRVMGPHWSRRNMVGLPGDPHCLFIDDRQQSHYAFLWGLSSGQVERIEFYDGGGMVRVYTKPFVLGLGGKELPSVFYSKGGLMGPICR